MNMNTLALPTPSNQLGAVTQMSIQPRYEDYVESAASLLPALESARFQREAQEEGLRIQREQREQQKRDAIISTGIQAVQTGTSLATNPVMQKYGAKVWNALTPKPPVSVASTVPSYATEGIASTVPSYATETIAPMQPIETAATTSTAPITLTPATGTEGGNFLTAGMDKFGSQTLAQQAGAVLGSTVGAFGAGQFARTTKLDENLEHLGLSKDAADVTGGALGGALTGFVASGFNPLGALVGGIFGGVGSKNKCVIVTAATSPDSIEVDMAREFRDKFVDRTTLRGYFMVAEWLVPTMQENEIVKTLVKEHLVDSLTRYAEWKLGYTKEHPSVVDCVVVRNFLSFCRDLGSTVKEFIRQDGEVV